MDEQYEKVCALLTDTIMLMCKNGIQFRNELKVQGLIGLTVDKHVFIIQINEVVKAEEKIQKKPHVTSEPCFRGVNFIDNDSTQENVATDYCNPTFSCGKPQKSDLNMDTKQPIELSKKMKKDFVEEDMTIPVVSKQVFPEDQMVMKEMDILQSAHLAFGSHSMFSDPSEQNSPINLHVGSRLQVVESKEPIREPPDIKPLTGDIEEWIANNGMPPDHISNGRKPYNRNHEMRRSDALNLKTSSRSFDANASCNSFFPPTTVRFNDKKRSACDDYDYDECEVSKFSCNLCPAAYKHYCNLLTHEVKVHGRQKKKGGRRKKLL